MNDQILLEIRDLKKYFPARGGSLGSRKWIRAVDGVSFVINQGETLGLVGESGCGKTTLMNVVLLLERATAGQVIFNGIELFKLKAGDLRKMRKDIQVVFQDPFWSLNPRLLVRDIVSEPLRVHLRLTQKELLRKVGELLEMVGISKTAIYKYPHEFSGGERQRIAIARALALKPKLLILDEPLSSVDVLSQTQILVLLRELKQKLDFTVILVSHDLSVVNYLSDKIAVMYLGEIVEIGPVKDVFRAAANPYTQALLRAVPNPEAEGIDSIFALEGEVPSAINPPPGCRFHTRCPSVMDICRVQKPPMVKLNTNHEASCWMLVEPKQIEELAV